MSIQSSPLKIVLVSVFLAVCVGVLFFSLKSAGMLDWLLVPKLPVANAADLVKHMPEDRRDAAKRTIKEALREYDAKNDKGAKSYKEGREAVELFAGYAVAGDTHGEAVLQRAAFLAGGAINDGSKDVMVQVVSDVMEYYNGHSRSPGDLQAHIERVEALAASGYPVACTVEPIGAGLDDLRRYELDKRPEQTDFVTEKRQSVLELGLNALRGIAGSDLPPGYLVAQAQWLADRYRRTPELMAEAVPKIEAVLVEVGASEADLALFRANALVVAGWQARGYGQPTPEGTKVYREKMREAAALLTKASDEAPGDPRLAAAMIPLVPSVSRDKAEVDKWFDRAVQADPKFYDAYNAKMALSQPGWGGSEVAVVEFARKCVATGYWENNVPYVAVAGIARMGNANKEAAKDAATWNLLYSAANKMISKYPASVRVRTTLMVAAMNAGQWKVAREQMEILGENWDRTFMTGGAYNRMRTAIEAQK